MEMEGLTATGAELSEGHDGHWQQVFLQSVFWGMTGYAKMRGQSGHPPGGRNQSTEADASLIHVGNYSDLKHSDIKHSINEYCGEAVIN